MTDQTLSDPRQDRVPWTLLVCALTLAAAVLRLYGIASWPLRGDEFYTIRDSQGLFAKGPKFYPT